MTEGKERASGHAHGPRLIAIVGPFQSGKTTLLEAILARTGALSRQGSVREGSSVGDASAQARAHAMSVEANIAATEYLGDTYTFIDCPGSLEFTADLQNVLPVCDAAVVVCEPDPRKVPALQLIMHEFEERGIPRLIFLNKIDQATGTVSEMLPLLQPASRVPLLLRQIPIWQGGIATGFIDLALERAFVYRERVESKTIEMPDDERQREREARYSMLERLSDYDDELLEKLLNDLEPPRDKVFEDLARDLREGHVVPVLLGSAEMGNGVSRLLKALRHEAPNVATLRDRLGIPGSGPPLAHVVRTIHTSHGGKLSVARVLRGSFDDGAAISNGAGEGRIAGVSRLMGSSISKHSSAGEGDTAAFGRLDNLSTGDSFVVGKPNGQKLPVITPAIPPEPVYALALSVKDRNDEVKLAAAIAKLVDEDSLLCFVQDQASGELKLSGQGEMHLRIALEQLATRFGITCIARKPQVAYRETILKPVNVRGRHKKQSGGHGQFGDVVLDVKPLQRGEGFQFSEIVRGGTVPKQYFSSVEAGCREALQHGPLGFPVVDVAATLTDGSFHSVDSSDMAFRTAARIGMSDALAKADPVLLEPVLSVEIAVPNEAMSRATAIISARRGQILGFDSRPGWDGWDLLQALLPEAESDGLIVELRSATAGVGSYTAKFDHFAEITGKPAEAIVAQAKIAVE